MSPDGGRPRRRWRETLVSVVLIGAVVVLVALQFTGASSRGSVPAPVPALDPPPALRLGVTTLALARNAYRPWRASDLDAVAAFERHAHRHADTVMWFADWAHTARFDAAQARAVAARGSTPEIAWEPWDSTRPLGSAQPGYRLRTITDGRHDAYLVRWARAIAAYGGPVRIRFAQEMNGTWYPWAERANGNHPGDFRAAWRHVRAIFHREGADNVTWIWAPVTGAVPSILYPGDAQVDVVGVSGFNGGTRLFAHRWRPFPAAFDGTLDSLHRLAPGKPIEIAEVGSTDEGGDKAAWIRDMFADLVRRSYVRSLVWFDVNKEADWRIESSLAAQHAFAAGLKRVTQPNVATRSW
ncbi:MAG: celH [Solirubrobacterales bacterium]|nr:celH [Solirubrobacterales bacterium]